MGSTTMASSNRSFSVSVISVLAGVAIPLRSTRGRDAFGVLAPRLSPRGPPRLRDGLAPGISTPAEIRLRGRRCPKRDLRAGYAHLPAPSSPEDAGRGAAAA